MRSARIGISGLGCIAALVVLTAAALGVEQDWWKPYSPSCTERENVFEFTEKLAIKLVAKDRYEITFAVKGNCDVTVGLVDEKGVVVRHLGSGVLGSNAPAPFQRNSLKQKIYWNGKDDLGVYVKEPEKLKLRVRLGLKPTFEKRLGGTSPHNTPGDVWGLTAAPDGVYVFTGPTKLYIRKFDHDGNYVKTVSPPPADLPISKLEGMGYIEYEPGRKALHARKSYVTTAQDGNYHTFQSGCATKCQPAVAGDRVYFCDSGIIQGRPVETSLYTVHTDGSTDAQGVAGRPLTWPIGTSAPKLAASPDGRWIYLATGEGQRKCPIVFRARVGEKGMAEPFLGNFRKDKKGNMRAEVGSDNRSFQEVTGIDCDTQGRIYVVDRDNNRVQVFSPEGEYLKTLRVDRPYLVQVHRKTGAIYVLHMARVAGKSTGRMTKYVSFDRPEEAFHIDGITAAAFALDSWSAKPWLWIGGRPGLEMSYSKNLPDYEGIRVYEEDGGTCRKILDFDEVARKADGTRYLGRWKGHMFGRTICDPVRNQLYFGKCKWPSPFVVDLESGEYVGNLRFPGKVDDIAFDKGGYLHCHFNPGFYMQGVGRLDPDRRSVITRGLRAQITDRPDARHFSYVEVPYDYGVMGKGGWTNRSGHNSYSGLVPRGQSGGWEGILPTKCQQGSKYFQDGLGVNMRGDVAVQSYVYYVPRMDDVSRAATVDGRKGGDGYSVKVGGGYGAFIHSVRAMQKEGEDVYFIKRRPGIPLAGGTVWTFDKNGELRKECAVIAGDLINGVQIDEDGAVYFVNARPRVVNTRPFLEGHGGIVGEPAAKKNRHPFTGTLIKGKADGQCRIILENAPVTMTPLPDRPADLLATDWPGTGGAKAWAEGAEWLYAGASPIVSVGCSCPTMRFHTDWFKRTYVPEAYRHSVGVLDAGGNLILHIGQYGNLDSADGPNSKIPAGGDGIAITFVRWVSGTEDRIAFDDYDERITVLKLDYHTEETAPLGK